MVSSVKRWRWRSAIDDDDEPSKPRLQPCRWAPLVTAVVCIGFLMLQMLPVSHIRHPDDPRIWIPIKKLDAFKSRDVEGLKYTTKNSVPQQSVPVHVFLCTDEKDIRPVTVVINSTLSNSRHPESIYFHIVTSESQHATWLLKLAALFPGSNIEILSDKINVGDIHKHIQFRTDSKTREELASPFNFLPFYIPQLFPTVERFVYLDTDVVVKADIEELYHTDFSEHAVAAVEDCSQKFETYFDFRLLNEIRVRHLGALPWIPRRSFDPKTCVFNRGVLVIDSRRWLQQNITEAIEWWMEQYHHSDTVLYKYGLSQPPFLLALYDNYKKLETSWNTRGLGRNKLSETEREYMHKLYLEKPARKPFLSPNADGSKILHFNGEFKPWKRNRINHRPVSLCGFKKQDCALLWWNYLSPAAEQSLLQNN